MNPAVEIARELGLEETQVQATRTLLEEGATVPFISRYRKEATGSLDEVQVAAVRDAWAAWDALEKRRAAILRSLAERQLLTDELAAGVRGAGTLAELEDIYLPHRAKRRTRATVARERGLEPLAERLLDQDPACDPTGEAGRFTDPSGEVSSAEDALAGARDIIAERVAEHAGCRARLRELFLAAGVIASRAKRGATRCEGAERFRDYFDAQEPASRAPSHRLLAMFRGERQGVLRLAIRPPEAPALGILRRAFVCNDSRAAAEVQRALADGYARLLAPSIENETRAVLKQRADTEAIAVFVDNLRELLLAPPLGERVTLAIDPGFRTGCKVVVLDAQGKLLHHETVFPHGGAARQRAAQAAIARLVEERGVEAIAVGNGTAGRETERFVRSIGLSDEIPVVSVNESGASIYSASQIAREEFPDCDVTVRGSISIGRRLMDPLAELIKIDPKSIGVGQYQHDVDPAALQRALDDVVASCVNRVGVDVNTASPQLLTAVSGLGPQLARNIVRHRDSHGPFSSRAALREVPRLGARAFQQCAGFLRVRGGEHPLDASAVHPESYGIVDRMAADLTCSVDELMRSEELRARLELEGYASGRVGLPTLRDILAELARPGRDPRARFEAFAFADGVEKLEDLEPGMRLPGIVTNVTAFGAFVDVGVHQDGLVHVSQLADRFVADAAEVVRVQQRVTVTVLEVDAKRRRIGLSMKGG